VVGFCLAAKKNRVFRWKMSTKRNRLELARVSNIASPTYQIMKKSFLKLAAAALLGAAVIAVPTLVRAQDTNGTSASAAPDATGPARFYGPVVAVDTNAMTFTVGDQTYSVTSESHLTKNNQPATLADAVVGEPARGTYTKGAGGKLEITKVRFGKGGGKKAGSGGGKSGGKKKKDSSGSTPDSATNTNTPPANQ
jgi:hypothetical protein